MLRLSPAKLEHDWQEILDEVGGPILRKVRTIAEANQCHLATHFYDRMLADGAASSLISHDQVKSKLHSSMMRWIASVFSVKPGDDLQPQIEQLVKIGEVHARIDVPVHLVLRGARNLKNGFYTLLGSDTALDRTSLTDAVRFVSAVIGLAMEMMSFAYSSSHDRHSRAEEAYRLSSVVQNIAAEQERQRAAVLDWENALMFELAVNRVASGLPRIHASEFGMWFRHKGLPAFEGAIETNVILQAMDHVDRLLLPQFEQWQDADDETKVQGFRDLRALTSSIGFNLDALFKQSNELESGRDVLTRLLNRKFLPVVMSKEVKYARERRSNFAVLAVDIDFFKQVNDTYGHEAGDVALKQLATLLVSASRGGDYTFRLGGEEFLVVLVDVTEKDGLRVSEKLRKLVFDAAFVLPGNQPLKLSVSIGLAFNNGHPDYQRTMNQADEALYEAKRAGRNRVVVAEDAAVRR